MGKRRGIDLLNKEQAKFINHIRAQDPDLANRISALQAPKWYRIKNSADGEQADVYIYDEIMPKWIADLFGSGVSAEGMIAELNEITASTINVRINSPGGAVFEAIAIYNALVTHSASINVFVDSLAASAASVIAMAGDKVTMMVGAQMMIHDASGVEMGNAAEMREFADFLDAQSDNIAAIYAEKSGGDPKELRDLMLAETWLYGKEAVELGLADEVYTRPSSQEGDEEEDPDKQNEPDPEDPDEESEEEMPHKEETSDEDEELEDLMNRQHRLVARGFKYPGRRKAPDPIDLEVDQIMAALGKR